MNSSIEKIESKIASKKDLAEKLRHEIKISTAVLAEYDADLENLDLELSKAKIAALGDWRPPSVDAYWKHAVARKIGDNKIDHDFTLKAFEKAGLSVNGFSGEGRFADFTVDRFDDEDLENDALREPLVAVLKAFVELYPASVFDRKFVHFKLGKIADDGEGRYSPYFNVKIAKEEKRAVQLVREFTGDNYIEDLVESVLKYRAKFLGIAYSEPAPLAGSGPRIG